MGSEHSLNFARGNLFRDPVTDYVLVYSGCWQDRLFFNRLDAPDHVIARDVDSQMARALVPMNEMEALAWLAR